MPFHTGRVVLHFDRELMVLLTWAVVQDPEHPKEAVDRVLTDLECECILILHEQPERLK